MLFIFHVSHAASRNINNIAEEANFSNNGARTIESGSPRGREDGEFIGIDFVVMSEIFTT